MSDRFDQGVDATLARLVASGALDVQQANQTRAEVIGRRPVAAAGDSPAQGPGRGGPDGAAGASWTSILAEVGGYVGAAFLLAAVAALLGPAWADLSRGMRAGLLGFPALVLAGAAVGAAGGAPGRWAARTTERGGPRMRLVAVLVLAAGALLGGTVAVLTETDGLRAQAVPLTLLAVWGLGFVGYRGPFLNAATVLAIGWSAGALAEAARTEDATAIGASVFAVGLGWAVLCAREVLAERSVGILAGGVAAFIGAEIVSTGPYALVGYGLLGVLAAAGLGGYIALRDLPALAVGAVSLAVVIPQAVMHYTQGGLGAAGALLVSGLSVVGVSTLAVRLHRERPGVHASP